MMNIYTAIFIIAMFEFYGILLKPGLLQPGFHVAGEGGAVPAAGGQVRPRGVHGEVQDRVPVRVRSQAWRTADFSPT